MAEPVRGEKKNSDRLPERSEFYMDVCSDEY